MHRTQITECQSVLQTPSGAPWPCVVGSGDNRQLSANHVDQSRRHEVGRAVSFRKKYQSLGSGGATLLGLWAAHVYHNSHPIHSELLIQCFLIGPSKSRYTKAASSFARAIGHATRTHQVGHPSSKRKAKPNPICSCHLNLTHSTRPFKGRCSYPSRCRIHRISTPTRSHLNSRPTDTPVHLLANLPSSGSAEPKQGARLAHRHSENRHPHSNW